MFKILLSFLLDRRGDTPGQGAPAPGNGPGGAPGGGPGGSAGAGDGGSGESGDGGAGGGAGAGDGAGAPAAAEAPKYGKYATPEALWTAHQALVGKTTQTERQFSGLRKSLEAMGFTAEPDPTTGEFRFVEKKQPQAPAKTKRFTDAHRALFDDPVLQAIEARAQDLFDESFESRMSEYENKGRERQTTMQQKIEAGNKLVKLFPGLKVPEGAKNVEGAWVFKDGKPDASFNSEFYEKATEIWKGNKAYYEHPQGELYAAMEAAMELGIAPTAIGAAKAEGFKQGTENKKILGPVDGGGQKKELKAGSLTKEQYLDLSPDEKEKYDKLSTGVTK